MSRSLTRALLCGALIFAFIAGSVAVMSSPARADAESEATPCDQVWAEVSRLVVQEARRGVTPGWLEKLNLLIPDLLECTDEAASDAAAEAAAESQPHWRVRRWEPLVSSYFSAADVERVLCLMDHESRGDPKALNPSSGASGLMQVMPFWADHFGYSREEMFNPAINLEMAAWILERHGWNSWSPYGRGLCR